MHGEQTMKTLRKETLQQINDEFPTFSWESSELEELVDPKLGVITAFSEILEQIETIMALDLGETGLASAAMFRESYDE